MATSKLSLINDCLLQCGQQPCNQADDGSTEWNVASAAYDKGLTRLLDEHNWKFATEVLFVDERTGDSTDPAYADEYAKPDDSLHVVWVQDEGGSALDYRIVGNRIQVNLDSGITVKVVRDVDPEQWPGLFEDTLAHFVFAGIYRGLSKDPVSARAEEKSAEERLRSARPRGDSEEPGRARFTSTLADARRTRRG